MKAQHTGKKLTQVTVKTVIQKKAERWKCSNLKPKCACVFVPGPLVQCFKAKMSITSDEKKAGGGELQDKMQS